MKKTSADTPGFGNKLIILSFPYQISVRVISIIKTTGQLLLSYWPVRVTPLSRNPSFLKVNNSHFLRTWTSHFFTFNHSQFRYSLKLQLFLLPMKICLLIIYHRCDMGFDLLNNLIYLWKKRWNIFFSHFRLNNFRRSPTLSTLKSLTA